MNFINNSSFHKSYKSQKKMKNQTTATTTNEKRRLSASTANYIRNFLVIFQIIFTFCLVRQTVESLIWMHFIMTQLLMQATKPNFKNATFHYLSGFLILVLNKLTFEQKIINIMLSTIPYAYYETILSRT